MRLVNTYVDVIKMKYLKLVQEEINELKPNCAFGLEKEGNIEVNFR